MGTGHETSPNWAPEAPRRAESGARRRLIHSAFPQFIHMCIYIYIRIIWCFLVHSFTYIDVCIYIYIYSTHNIYIHIHIIWCFLVHSFTHLSLSVYIYIYIYILHIIYVYIYIYIPSLIHSVINSLTLRLIGV